MDSIKNSAFLRERLQSFEDIQDVAVYIVDLRKGAILYMGMPVLELTGLPPSYYTKGGFASLFENLHEVDFSRIKDKYASALWSPRDPFKTQPEIFSDVFRTRSESGDIKWLENTLLILNYDEQHLPKKAMGYLKAVQADRMIHFKERMQTLRNLIMGSKPPQGLAQLSALKNWHKKDASELYKDSLLEVAFHGQLSFKLTKREREILKLIANGYSAKEIANMLFISASTVVTHRRNLIDKFEVKNVAELVKEASKFFHFN